MPNPIFRKLADQSVERIKIFDPFTGEPVLMEPVEAEELIREIRPVWLKAKSSPRPLVGMKIEGEMPDTLVLSTSFIAKGKSEGWIEVEGGTRVHRSSGPKSDPWGNPPHTFIHYDRITIKTVDGDFSFKVVEQPDKWPEEKGEDDDSGHGGEVKWFYSLELEASDG